VRLPHHPLGYAKRLDLSFRLLPVAGWLTGSSRKLFDVDESLAASLAESTHDLTG
jgi:hypothetical protein